MGGIAKRRLETIENISGPIPVDARVLDFGCGTGGNVRDLLEAGYQAYGMDIYPTVGGVDYRELEEVKPLHERGILKFVTLDNYSIPFPDDTFDVVFSDEVFEHVADYGEVLDELHRVMKPGARSLNVFPSRYRPIEAHVYVPFSSVIQNYRYLKFWAALGIRNEFQKELGAEETAKANMAMLQNGCNYLTKSEIRREVERIFENCSFEELEVFKQSSRGKLFGLLDAVPGIEPLISTLQSRALYFEKPSRSSNH